MGEGDRPRVLWLSNAELSAGDPGLTGTWLHAMARGLVRSDRVTLGNVTTGRVTSLTRADAVEVIQWIGPSVRRLRRNGLPRANVVSAYLTAIQEFRPDLIHVWGAETFPGLLTARGLVGGPVLLEMQGLKGPLAQLYDGGLTLSEQLKCTGVKEIIRCSTVPQERSFYKRWGRFEREIMANHRFITTPSPWMAAHALAANPSATLFQNDIPLRRAFLTSKPWAFTGAPIIFCSVSYSVPHKALHTLIRAAAIVRGAFPELRIRIAGPHQAPGLRLSGYVRWLNGEIRRTGLESNVEWLGTLDAERLTEELAQASVAVFPSYAESYGVAHAEAMMVGTPTVCAFNGGSSYLARDGESALFFPPGDHAVCARLVGQVLTDRSLAERLSTTARAIAVRRHDPATIVERQLQIYSSVLQETAPHTRR